MGLAALLPHTAVADAYKLQQGDVLTMSVAGVPGLERQMPVDIDGNIAVPLAGTIVAVGHTLESIAEELRASLSSTSYSIFDTSGDVTSVQISPTSVTLDVLTYRPVYVDGDVTAPGEFAYAPGLTARRAIALAGGYGLAALRNEDPTREILALGADLRALEIRRSAAEVRVNRLRAELDGEDATFEADPADAVAGSFADVERARLETDRDRARERTGNFGDATQKTRRQIGLLQDQYANETAGVAQDTADLDRLREAQASGTITASRLSDTRRTLLFSTTRQLETGSELVRTELELDKLEHERTQDKLAEREEDLAALSEELVQIKETDAQIAGLRRRLVYFGDTLVGFDDEDRVSITVETAGGAIRELAAAEDVDLMPGDLLRVRMDPMLPDPGSIGSRSHQDQ